MGARRGIFVAPFGELAEPARVAELAARAEERGWDGFDGVFPIDLPGPEALAELVREVQALRGTGGMDGFEVVVSNPPGIDPAPWISAGATWCLTGLGSRASVARVRKAIDAH